MKKVISISLGELVLKGGNRGYFEGQLVRQIRKSVDDLGLEKLYKDQGKIYLELPEEKHELAIKRLKNVFGLVYISPCLRVEKNLDSIRLGSIECMKNALENSDKKTFKVETNRSDKTFEIKSPEMSRMMGGVILKEFGYLKVDVHNPEITLNIDIKEHAYIYTEKIKGHRGLPVGTNGQGLLLLSGGIDSPVAGFIMGKRGLQINCVHYHSYPFTSDRAEEKVVKLSEILSRYVGKINFFSVNILEIQKAIAKNCPEKEMTILSRRFMMRIAETIAKKHGYKALITGESLGQVASQTLEGISVINSVVEMPILRPLIGIDKIDIIEVSREIDAYETSILPYEDCCSVFSPKHPVLNPKLEDIEKSEEELNIDELVNNAIKGMKHIVIK